jgi:hypothetical protein
MEAVSSSVTSADIQRSTRRYIPEDRTVQSLDLSGTTEGKFYKQGILERALCRVMFLTELLGLLS